MGIHCCAAVRQALAGHSISSVLPGHDSVPRGASTLSFKAFLLAGVLLLHGCAMYKPVPDGYAGPVAVISDSGFSETGTKAQIFAVTAVDGNTIDNSFFESASANQGRGFSLSPRFVSRPVPVRSMRLTLKGSHATGAPIHAMFSQISGSFLSVEGTVDFLPVPGGQYVVKGELGQGGSSVWIEDSTTGKLATQKITR